MSDLFMANRWLRAGAATIGLSRLAAQRSRTMRVVGLTKSQAEDLLDWLEANGYRDYQLVYTAGKGFTVSFSNSRETSG